MIFIVLQIASLSLSLPFLNGCFLVSTIITFFSLTFFCTEAMFQWSILYIFIDHIFVEHRVSQGDIFFLGLRPLLLFLFYDDSHHFASLLSARDCRKINFFFQYFCSATQIRTATVSQYLLIYRKHTYLSHVYKHTQSIYIWI